MKQDISKKELLTLVIRYFSDESKGIVEHFVGLAELDNLDAASTTEKNHLYVRR